MLLVDYSYARPGPLAIRGAGYSGVVRYLSLDPTMTWTCMSWAPVAMAGLAKSNRWSLYCWATSLWRSI
jgi:hypothetical protein